MQRKINSCQIPLFIRYKQHVTLKKQILPEVKKMFIYTHDIQE